MENITTIDANARAPQSDEEFIAACNMLDVTQAPAIALAVRREVARRAGVDSAKIWATDRLPEEWGDLFVRESLDVAEFILELEREFGVSIPDWATVIFSRASVRIADLAAALAGSAVEREIGT